MNRASSRVNKGQYNTVKFHNTPDSIIQKSKAKKPQQPKQPKQPRQPRQPRQPANNPIQEQPVVDAPQNNVAMPAVYIGNTVIPDENFLTMSDEDYWRDNFYIPNDHITKDYYEIAEIYPEIPESMIYGLGDLEVKTPEPIKEKPSLTKLINGDYQTEQSKSDKNIATSIRFFVKKFTDIPTI